MKKITTSLIISSLVLTMLPLTAFAEENTASTGTTATSNEAELTERRERYAKYLETKERRENYTRSENAEENEELKREKLVRRIEIYQDKLEKLREALNHFEKAVSETEGREQYLYRLRVKIIRQLMEKVEEKIAELTTNLENSKQIDEQSETVTQ